MFRKLDHIAIIVKNTEEALRFYRDTLKLPVVLSEVMEDSQVRLTHLDLGNLHLQLVEPLTEGHPLRKHLMERGEGLHHLCWLVDNVPGSLHDLEKAGLKPRDPAPHRGPRGRRAAFIDPGTTRGVLWELTAESP